MRVINSAGTVQQIRAGKWRGHMATRASTQKPTAIINGVLMLCEGQVNLTLIHKMAISDRLPSVMSLLNCNRLLVVAKPSSCTTTGRKCQILYCIEMVEDAHFLHNLLCCFRTAATALNSDSERQIPHSPSPTSHFIPRPAPPSTRRTNSNQANMPHLRHRMQCRSGSNRGKATCPPSSSLSASTPSDSSSPSTAAHFTSRYPSTRSGRGHAQTVGSKSAVDAHYPPDASVPTMQPYHSTQFQFCCMLEHPCIIATISIAFREEPQSSVISAHII